MTLDDLKYFTRDELRCSHTGDEGMDVQFMQFIEELREELGAFLAFYEATRFGGAPEAAALERWRRGHRALTRRVARALRAEARRPR